MCFFQYVFDLSYYSSGLQCHDARSRLIELGDKVKKSMNVLKVQYIRLLDAGLPSFVCLVLKGLKVNNACRFRYDMTAYTDTITHQISVVTAEMFRHV